MCCTFADLGGQQHVRSAENAVVPTLWSRMMMSMRVEPMEMMMVIVQWRMTWMRRKYEKMWIWKTE